MFNGCFQLQKWVHLRRVEGVNHSSFLDSVDVLSLIVLELRFHRNISPKRVFEFFIVAIL